MAKVTGSSKGSVAKGAVGGALVGAMIANNSNKKSTTTSSQPVAKKSKWSWRAILFVIFFIAFVFYLVYSYNSVPPQLQPQGFISSYI